MKRLVVCFVAGLSLAVFTSFALAAEAPKIEPAEKVEAKAEMKADTILGKIMKIEKAKNEIVAFKGRVLVRRIIPRAG
ncbi:MAG: hypothetical protein ABFD81_13600 [Syntrophaceae bacterium]